MLKKLRLKFILINMGIVACMLLIIFATVYHFTRLDLENQSTAALDSLSKSMQQPGREPGRDVRLPYFTVKISINGNVVAGGYSYYDLTDEAFIQELIAHVYKAKSNTGAIKAYNLRYKTVSSVGVQTIFFVDISSHQAALTTLIQVCMLIGVVSLAAFFGISLLLARWAVKPVEKAWLQQQQFISDASHELKTPLTVIMSNAELLQSPDCDDTSRAQFTDNIVTVSHRMRHLVEGLLELARADNGYAQSTFEKLDYSALVSDALLPFEPVMFERGQMLQSDIGQQIFLMGSAQHLGQVVEILLDNGAKYGASGIVEVKLCRQGRDSCLLTVSTPGNPIPQEDLQRIFERFYRADRARTGGGSFGLGLSIAKSHVEKHGGKIWAKSNETGNCFYVQLPCYAYVSQ